MFQQSFACASLQKYIIQQWIILVCLLSFCSAFYIFRLLHKSCSNQLFYQFDNWPLGRVPVSNLEIYHCIVLFCSYWLNNLKWLTNYQPYLCCCTIRIISELPQSGWTSTPSTCTNDDRPWGTLILETWHPSSKSGTDFSANHSSGTLRKLPSTFWKTSDSWTRPLLQTGRYVTSRPAQY